MPVQVMPDDHSKLVPPLPIPNRTVKQLCADDSAATSVKVGYRQACYSKKPLPVIRLGFFFVWWFCQAPRVVSAYARCAKPTYGQPSSSVGNDLCVSGMEGLSPVVQVLGFIDSRLPCSCLPLPDARGDTTGCCSCSKLIHGRPDAGQIRMAWHLLFLGID